jgi:hypothetical protein
MTRSIYARFCIQYKSRSYVSRTPETAARRFDDDEDSDVEFDIFDESQDGSSTMSKGHLPMPMGVTIPTAFWNVYDEYGQSGGTTSSAQTQHHHIQQQQQQQLPRGVGSSISASRGPLAGFAGLGGPGQLHINGTISAFELEMTVSGDMLLEVDGGVERCMKMIEQRSPVVPYGPGLPGSSFAPAESSSSAALGQNAPELPKAEPTPNLMEAATTTKSEVEGKGKGSTMPKPASMVQVPASAGLGTASEAEVTDPDSAPSVSSPVVSTALLLLRKRTMKTKMHLRCPLDSWKAIQVLSCSQSWNRLLTGEFDEYEPPRFPVDDEEEHDAAAETEPAQEESGEGVDEHDDGVDPAEESLVAADADVLGHLERDKLGVRPGRLGEDLGTGEGLVYVLGAGEGS